MATRAWRTPALPLSGKKSRLTRKNFLDYSGRERLQINGRILGGRHGPVPKRRFPHGPICLGEVSSPPTRSSDMHPGSRRDGNVWVSERMGPRSASKAPGGRSPEVSLISRQNARVPPQDTNENFEQSGATEYTSYSQNFHVSHKCPHVALFDRCLHRAIRHFRPAEDQERIRCQIVTAIQAGQLSASAR